MPRMKQLLLAYAAAVLTIGCGGPTSSDFDGTWTGSGKIVVTNGSQVADRPLSGSNLLLTTEGSGTLVSTAWASECPLKFTQGTDPMRFQLTTTICNANDGSRSDFKTGTLLFPTMNAMSMDVSGNLTTASGGTAVFTLTFSGSRP